MKSYSWQSLNVEETQRLGQTLSSLTKPGDIICLSGDLGTGKTTLVKSIAQGLKINPRSVQSPTFVLMNAYQGKLPLYHFDLYRLDDQKSIRTLEYDEFLYGEGLSVIEWAERLGELSPKEFLEIKLHYGKDIQERTIDFKAHGAKYEVKLQKIKSKL